jgi:hypothetical protein
MFDLLENLLGGGDRKGRRNQAGLDDEIGGILRGVTRWIIGCGCFLILAVVVITGIVLVSVGEFGDEALVIVVLAVMTIMGIISLARLSLAGRF